MFKPMFSLHLPLPFLCSPLGNQTHIHSSSLFSSLSFYSMGMAFSSTGAQQQSDEIPSSSTLANNIRQRLQLCDGLRALLDVQLCQGTVFSSRGRQQQSEAQNEFDQIAPHSPSSSPLPNNFPYDVFINHRGPDVKHTLASSIYHTLDLLGFTAFFDKEELQLGDSIPKEIQDAISRASLHIAILSPSYAQSPWCLDELSFMLKTGTKLIPVFYHTKPSDIRWIIQGKGIYAHAFSEHQKKGRYTAEELEEWKEALHRVSDYSGYILINKKDEGMPSRDEGIQFRDEGTLLKSIVNCVMKEIKKDSALVVAKHPVGLDETVQNFEKSTPSASEENVQIVGIVGMGGSGKTTLAKELYNRKRSSFQRCSFLSDVRDAAGKKELHKKQQKLLTDLGDRDSRPLDNIEEGKGALARRLRSLSVLIILDDVDHVDLLPAKDSFGSSKSLVIVTTRRMDVLTSLAISQVYTMVGLNHSHAKQLFCWHAFLQPFSVHGFEDLVEKFLNTCQGLPLSLKVLGAQLYGRSKDYWEAHLRKISRILPEDIKERLKLSYDVLDKDEKEIFLDTACFFIGEEKSVAVAVWDGSGWSGVYSLENLMNKCLLELDVNNRIRMHDHLRDLGREIAITHTPYRLWSAGEIFNIEKQSEKSLRIRGINAEINDSTAHQRQLKECMELIANSSRSGLKHLKLQILTVTENCFLEEFSIEDLVWLRCTRFQLRNLPLSISLRNLSVLQLIDSEHLEELWEEPRTHPPSQLRQLIIHDAPAFKRFPSSIECLKHLKKFVLCFSRHIQILPEEFCHLRWLEHLELRYCEMLSSLPTHFGNLTNLRRIDLEGCKLLKMLPVSFKQLKHLQHLNLGSCRELSFRLDMLENVTMLEYVNFRDCKELGELPLQITNLASLREMKVQGTSLREIPSNIVQLNKLEELEIGSSFLSSLPEAPWQLPNLRTLGIFRCPISELPFGSGSSFCNLKRIRLEGTQVSKISISEDCCPSLESISVSGTDNLVEIQALPKTVKELYLSKCKMLKNIGDIGGLENLKELGIWDLEELDIGSSFLSSLPEAPWQLPNLRSLRILRCPISELPFGSGSSFCNLKHIRLEGTQVSKISISEDCCPSLESIFVSANDNLVEIQALPKTVKELDLSKCKMLRNIGFIRALENLQTLSIFRCPISELPFGSGSSFSNLKHISLEDTQVSKISISEDCCPSLEIISVWRSDNLVEIQALPKTVKTLQLLKCRMLKNIGAIGGLENLTVLGISDCPELDELPSLDRLRSLEVLTINSMWKVAGIQSLEKMERLREVQVVAEKASAIQPCIQSIKKWPAGMKICARAVDCAESVVKPLVFGNVSVVETEDDREGLLTLECPHETPSVVCYIICYVINCSSEVENIAVLENNQWYTPSEWRMKEGKWAWIGVFREDIMHKKEFRVQSNKIRSDGIRVEKGILGSGEEGKVREAFQRLLAVFES